ncbi:MAG: glycosyltransferase family 4 protein [Bacteroides sp.]|nr:glycosyltransferase family 4 protein [Bacteroides sp.]
MKILHVVPGLRSGGVAQVVYDLSKSQIAKGWEVSVISIHKDGYDDNAQRFADIDVTIDIIITRTRFDIGIINKLRKKFIDFDIVHVHLFPNQLLASLANRFIVKSKRPKLITTEHSTWNNRRKYKILRSFDRYMYAAYDRIVTISPQTYSTLTEWLKSNKLSKKIININNGVEISKFQIGWTDLLRTMLHIPENHVIVTMVARMSYPKDPVTLVKAAALIKKIDVVFIGDGILNDSVREEAERLGISKRVHILGLRNDVPSLLSDSDIGCLSTKWDGFGLVAVEYMAAGLPVLVTDVPGLREVVGCKEALFPYKDYKTLANKLEMLINSNEYNNSQREYSLERCRLFDVHNMTSAYNSLYSELVSNDKEIDVIIKAEPNTYQ